MGAKRGKTNTKDGIASPIAPFFLVTFNERMRWLYFVLADEEQHEQFSLRNNNNIV